MNVKLDSDRLDGAQPIQNTALSGAHRRPEYSPIRGGDSATISELTARVTAEISLERARIEKRVSELATLYARGDYQPDAAALSQAIISRALSSDGVES